MPERLTSAYEPPRFVLGDCHRDTFFLVDADRSWQVTGAADLEVASAGDAGEDVMNLCTELAAVLPASCHWWEALFDGYGSVPHFDLMKLRLLGTEPAEYTWTDRWPKRWDDVLRHVMSAKSWHQLFDLGPAA